MRHSLEIKIFVAAIAITIAMVAKADIKVMVIDTGIAPHSLLNKNVQYQDTDDYEDAIGHGTHVAGIIMYGNKNKKISDFGKDFICPEIKIYSCRYYFPEQFYMTDEEAGLARKEREIQCFHRAIREGMQIVNLSGGGSEFDQEEYNVVKDFIESGGLLIAAAGNDGKNIATNPFYPAAYATEVKIPKYSAKLNRLHAKQTVEMIDAFVPLKRIIVVESTVDNNKLAHNSNTMPGAFREIGVNIFSTMPYNKFGYLSGTSMATPAFLHEFLKQICNKLEGK